LEENFEGRKECKEGREGQDRKDTLFGNSIKRQSLPGMVLNAFIFDLN
jgi:hypothetical protein